MRNLLRHVLPLMLLPTAGFAATPEFEDSRARTEPIVAQFARRADADSLAAAGLLSFWDRQQSLRLLAQASRAAPERADLLWLHVQFCLEDASCDTEPLERTLRTLDPKNGAGWFAALAHAARKKDEAANVAALGAIARSERVETYWTTLISRLTRPIVSTGKEAPLNAMSSVIGALAAIAIPGYQAATSTCKDENLEREDLLETCRGIADSLSKGDTILTEMVGHSIKQQDVMKAILVEIGKDPAPPGLE